MDAAESWGHEDEPPRKIRIEASTACQLACPACPTTQGRIGANLGTAHLTRDTFRRILDRAPWARAVELSNWGEALLNPHLVAILEHAHDRGLTLTLENGVNFNRADDALLSALVRTRVARIKVSIDGATPETYATYRRGGDLETVLGNIRRLNAIKRDHGSDRPRLKWQFVAFEHNAHEIERAREMARELGMKFKVKLAWKDAHGPPAVRSPALREAVSRRSGTGTATRDEYYAVNRQHYNRRNTCLQLWTAPQVNHDGRILGCCVNHWGDFGNALETDPVRAPALLDARAMLMGRPRGGAPTPCSTCHHYRKIQQDETWITPGEIAAARRLA